MHVNWKQLPGCKFWLPCVYPIELNLIIRCEQCSDQTLVMPLYQSNHSKQRLMVMVEIKSYLYDSSNSIFYVYVGKIRMFTLKWPRGNCFIEFPKSLQTWLIFVDQNENQWPLALILTVVGKLYCVYKINKWHLYYKLLFINECSGNRNEITLGHLIYNKFLLNMMYTSNSLT